MCNTRLGAKSEGSRRDPPGGNNKKKVDWLAQKMRGANFPIASIHGDMLQKAPS